MKTAGKMVRRWCASVVVMVWLAMPCRAAGLWEQNVGSGFALGEKSGVILSDEQGGIILASSGNNLLADPSFEAPPQSCLQMKEPYGLRPRLRHGWEHNGLGDKTGAMHPAPFSHSGARAWELVDTARAGEPALLQYVEFKPEYRGKSFLFRVWARTREGTNAQAMIALKFSSKTHWRCDVSRPLVVGPEWKPYSVTATAPPDADELGVVIGPSSFEGQGAILVDDAALTVLEYAKDGVFTSEAHDMGAEGSRVWRAECRKTLPEGTGVRMLLRVGNTPTPDALWSVWGQMPETRYVPVASPTGRYVQFRVELRSTSPDRTPVVHSVQLHHGAHLAFVSGEVTHARPRLPARRTRRQTPMQWCPSRRTRP